METNNNPIFNKLYGNQELSNNPYADSPSDINNNLLNQPTVNSVTSFDGLWNNTYGNIFKTSSASVGSIPTDLSEYTRLDVQYDPRSPIKSADKRAENQSTLEQLGNAGERFIKGVGIQTISSAASMLDLEDYFNSDGEIGNAITRWADRAQKSLDTSAPIYIDSKRNDMGNPSWWIKNGADLSASIVSFGLTGAAVGRGLSALKWLNNLTKGYKATKRTKDIGAAALDAQVGAGSRALSANTIESIANGQKVANTLISSTMLNQAEGISSASNVFDETYNEAISRGLSPDKARELAASSAAYTINVNRANILLNLTSASKFLKKADRLADARTIHSNKLKDVFRFRDKASGDAVRSSIREVFSEAGQEALEELINVYAETRGKERSEELFNDYRNIGSSYFKGLFDVTDVYGLGKQAATKEGIEAMVLGALGGAGQAGITSVINEYGGGKFLGEQVYKLDNEGKRIRKETEATYDKDTRYNAGEIASKDIVDSNGNILAKKGDVVTEEMIVNNPASFVHKQGDTVLDKEGKPIITKSDEFEMVNDGVYMSVNKAARERRQQAIEASERLKKYAEISIKMAESGRNDERQYAAMEAVSVLEDPRSTSIDKNNSLDLLARWSLNGSEAVVDFNTEEGKKALQQEKNKLRGLSTTELGTIRNQAKGALVREQVWRALESGAENSLERMYQDIIDLSPEEAERRGFNENYKEEAQSVLNQSKKLREYYKEYNAKYDPVRAKKLYNIAANALHDNQLYRNLEANKQSLMSEITQSYDTEEILEETIQKIEDINKQKEAELKPYEEQISKIDDRITSLMSEEDFIPTASDSEVSDFGDEGYKYSIELADRKSNRIAEITNLNSQKKSIEEKMLEISKKYSNQLSNLSSAFSQSDITKIEDINESIRKLKNKIESSNKLFAKVRDRKDSKYSGYNLNEKARIQSMFKEMMNDLIRRQNDPNDNTVITFNPYKKVGKHEAKAITISSISLREGISLEESFNNYIDMIIESDVSFVESNKDDILNEANVKLIEHHVDEVIKVVEQKYKDYNDSKSLNDPNKLYKDFVQQSIKEYLNTLPDKLRKSITRSSVYQNLNDIESQILSELETVSDNSLSVMRNIQKLTALGFTGTAVDNRDGSYDFLPNYESFEGEFMLVGNEDVDYYSSVKIPGTNDNMFDVTEMSSGLYSVKIKDPNRTIKLTSDNFHQIGAVNKVQADIKKLNTAKTNIIRSRRTRFDALRDKKQEERDRINKSIQDLAEISKSRNELYNKYITGSVLDDIDAIVEEYEERFGELNENLSPNQMEKMIRLSDIIDEVERKGISSESTKTRVAKELGLVNDLSNQYAILNQLYNKIDDIRLEISLQTSVYNFYTSLEDIEEVDTQAIAEQLNNTKQSINQLIALGNDIKIIAKNTKSEISEITKRIEDLKDSIDTEAINKLKYELNNYNTLMDSINQLDKDIKSTITNLIQSKKLIQKFVNNDVVKEVEEADSKLRNQYKDLVNYFDGSYAPDKEVIESLINIYESVYVFIDELGTINGVITPENDDIYNYMQDLITSLENTYKLSQDNNIKDIEESESDILESLTVLSNEVNNIRLDESTGKLSEGDALELQNKINSISELNNDLKYIRSLKYSTIVGTYAKSLMNSLIPSFNALSRSRKDGKVMTSSLANGSSAFAKKFNSIENLKNKLEEVINDVEGYNSALDVYRINSFVLNKNKISNEIPNLIDANNKSLESINDLMASVSEVLENKETELSSLSNTKELIINKLFNQLTLIETEGAIGDDVVFADEEGNPIEVDIDDVKAYSYSSIIRGVKYFKEFSKQIEQEISNSKEQLESLDKELILIEQARERYKGVDVQWFNDNPSEKTFYESDLGLLQDSINEEITIYRNKLKAYEFIRDNIRELIKTDGDMVSLLDKSTLEVFYSDPEQYSKFLETRDINDLPGDPSLIIIQLIESFDDNMYDYLLSVTEEIDNIEDEVRIAEDKINRLTEENNELQQKINDIDVVDINSKYNISAEQNAYEILGLDYDANYQDIADAYARINSEYRNNPNTSTRDIINLNNSYTVLINPKTRSQYDSDLEEQSEYIKRLYEAIDANNQKKLDIDSAVTQNPEYYKSIKISDVLKGLADKMSEIGNTVRENITELESIGNTISEAYDNIDEIEKIVESINDSKNQESINELFDKQSKDQIGVDATGEVNQFPVTTNDIESDNYREENEYEESETILKKKDKITDSGAHIQYEEVLDKKGRPIIRTKYDKEGNPVFVNNASMIRWKTLLGRLFRGEIIDGKGQPVELNSLSIRMISADHPEIANTLAYSSGLYLDSNNNFSGMGLKINEDGNIIIGDRNVYELYIDNYNLNYTTIPADDKKAIKELKSKVDTSPFTVKELDLLFRYQESSTGSDNLSSTVKARGKGVFMTFADAEGNLMSFNLNDNKMIPASNKQAGYEIIGNTTSSPLYARRLQFKNNLAAIYSDQQKLGEELSFTELITELREDNPNSTDDEIFIEIKSDTSNETVRASISDLSKMEDSFTTNGDIPIKKMVRSIIQNQIQEYNTFRNKVLSTEKLGGKIYDPDFTISNGHVLISNNFRSVTDIFTLSEIADIKINTNKKDKEQKRRSSPGEPVDLKVGNKIIEVNSKVGQIVIATTDGNYFKAKPRKLNRAEASMVLNTILVDFGEFVEDLGSKFKTTNNAVDTEGNKLELTSPLIRFSAKENADIDDLPLISKLIFFSGKKFDAKDRMPWDISVEKTSSGNFGRKNYLHYGPNEVSIQALKENRNREQDKFLEWAQEYLNVSVSNKALTQRKDSEYYHPVDISYDSVTKQITTQFKKYKNYTEYLFDEDVLLTDAITKSESEALGGMGETIVGRYVSVSKNPITVTPKPKTKPKAPKEESKGDGTKDTIYDTEEVDLMSVNLQDVPTGTRAKTVLSYVIQYDKAGNPLFNDGKQREFELELETVVTEDSQGSKILTFETTNGKLAVIKEDGSRNDNPPEVLAKQVISGIVESVNAIREDSIIVNPFLDVMLSLKYSSDKTLNDIIEYTDSENKLYYEGDISKEDDDTKEFINSLNNYISNKSIGDVLVNVYGDKVDTFLSREIKSIISIPSKKSAEDTEDVEDTIDTEVNNDTNNKDKTIIQLFEEADTLINFLTTEKVQLLSTRTDILNKVLPTWTNTKIVNYEGYTGKAKLYTFPTNDSKYPGEQVIIVGQKFKTITNAKKADVIMHELIHKATSKKIFEYSNKLENKKSVPGNISEAFEDANVIRAKVFDYLIKNKIPFLNDNGNVNRLWYNVIGQKAVNPLRNDLASTVDSLITKSKKGVEITYDAFVTELKNNLSDSANSTIVDSMLYDIHEMTAAVFEDREFATILNNIEYEPVKGQYKTLTDVFLDMLRNLLGLDIKSNSALKKAIDVSLIFSNADTSIYNTKPATKPSSKTITEKTLISIPKKDIIGSASDEDWKKFRKETVEAAKQLNELYEDVVASFKLKDGTSVTIERQPYDKGTLQHYKDASIPLGVYRDYEILNVPLHSPSMYSTSMSQNPDGSYSFDGSFRLDKNEDLNTRVKITIKGPMLDDFISKNKELADLTEDLIKQGLRNVSAYTRGGQASAQVSFNRLQEQVVDTFVKYLKESYEPASTTITEESIDIIQTNSPTIQTIDNVTFGTAGKQDSTDNNEDAVYVDTKEGIYILADGMGGEGMVTMSSSQASRSVINKLLDKKQEPNLTELLYEEYTKNKDITIEEAVDFLRTKGLNIKGAMTSVLFNLLNSFKTKRDLTNKKGYRSGATALKASKVGENTYSIEKVGDTVFFVVDKNGKVIEQHGLSDDDRTTGFMFSVKDGKPSVSNPKLDKFTVTLNEGETLVLATDFIQTNKAIQDFIDSDFGKKLNFAEFQNRNKKDDSTFIVIEYSTTITSANTIDISIPVANTSLPLSSLIKYDTNSTEATELNYNEKQLAIIRNNLTALADSGLYSVSDSDLNRLVNNPDLDIVFNTGSVKPVDSNTIEVIEPITITIDTEEDIDDIFYPELGYPTEDDPKGRHTDFERLVDKLLATDATDSSNVLEELFDNISGIPGQLSNIRFELQMTGSDIDLDNLESVLLDDMKSLTQEVLNGNSKYAVDKYSASNTFNKLISRYKKALKDFKTSNVKQVFNSSRLFKNDVYDRIAKSSSLNVSGNINLDYTQKAELFEGITYYVLKNVLSTKSGSLSNIDKDTMNSIYVLSLSDIKSTMITSKEGEAKTVNDSLQQFLDDAINVYYKHVRGSAKLTKHEKLILADLFRLINKHFEDIMTSYGYDESFEREAVSGESDSDNILNSIPEYVESYKVNPIVSTPVFARILISSVPKKELDISYLGEDPKVVETNIEKLQGAYDKLETIEDSLSSELGKEDAVRKFLGAISKSVGINAGIIARKNRLGKKFTINEMETIKSIIKQAKPEIQNIIKSKKVIKTKVVNNSFGLPTLENYGRIWNYIARNLSSKSPDYGTLKDALYQVSSREKYKESYRAINGLDEISKQLATMEDMSDPVSVSNIASILQSFSKFEMMHTIVISDSGGNLYETIANIDRKKSTILNKWISGITFKVSESNKETSSNAGSKITRSYLRKVKRVFDKSNLSPEQASIAALEEMGIVFNDPKSVIEQFESHTNQNIKEFVRAMISYLDGAVSKEAKLIFSSREDIISGRINDLLDLELKNDTDLITNQFLNEDGELVYGLQLNHTLSLITSRINNSKVQYIDGRYVVPGAPYLSDDYARNSTILSNVSRGKKLTLAVVSGTRFNQKGETGVDTSKLQKGDSLAVQITSALSSGTYMIPRAADRKVFNALKIEGKTMMYDNYNQAVFGYMKYLLDELTVMKKYAKEGVPLNNIDLNKATNYRFFDVILGKSESNPDPLGLIDLFITRNAAIPNDINGLVDFSYVDDSGKETNLYDAISKSINEFFNGVPATEYDTGVEGIVDRYVRILKEEGVADRTPKIRSQSGTYVEKGYFTKYEKNSIKSDKNDNSEKSVEMFQGISKELFLRYREILINNGVEATSDNILKELVRDYLVNQLAFNIEFTKLFSGDPAFYGTEDSFFKRMSMINSTRNITAVGESLDNDLNKYNGAKLIMNDGSVVKISRTKAKNIILGIEELGDDVYDMKLMSGFRMDGRKHDSSFETIVFDDHIHISDYAKDDVKSIDIDKETNEVIYYDYKKNEIDKSDVSLYRKKFVESFIRQGIKDPAIIHLKSEIRLKPYLSITETDGFSIVTLDEYRVLLMRSGAWQDEHDEAYIKILRGEELSSNEYYLFQPQKTQYTGPMDMSNIPNTDPNYFVPNGYKHAIIPALPSVYKGTNLEPLIQFLEENQISMASFGSVNKFGRVLDNTSRTNKFYKQAGNGKLVPALNNWNPNNKQSTYYEFYGIQVENKPKLKNDITNPSQKRKIITSDIFEYGKANDSELEKLATEYIRLQNALVEESIQSLRSRLGIKYDESGFNVKIKNKKLFIELLTEQAKSRDADDNILEAIDLISSGMYVDQLGSAALIDNVLMAYVRNKIVREKRPGESYAQTPSTGFEKSRVVSSSKLKYYREDLRTGHLIPAQLVVPLRKNMLKYVDYIGGLQNFNKKLKDLHNKLYVIRETSNEDNISLTEEEQALLNITTVIGSRIPTQQLGSIGAFEIIEFLPIETGNTAQVPPEIVAQMGSDYDWDKLNIEHPVFSTYKDKIHYYNNSNVNYLSEYFEYVGKQLRSDEFKIKKLVKSITKQLSKNTDTDWDSIAEASQAVNLYTYNLRKNKFITKEEQKQAEQAMFSIVNSLTNLSEESLTSVVSNMLESRKGISNVDFAIKTGLVSEDNIYEVSTEEIINTIANSFDEMNIDEFQSSILHNALVEIGIKHVSAFSKSLDDKKVKKGFVSVKHGQNRIIELQKELLLHKKRSGNFLSPVDDSPLAGKDLKQGVVWKIRFLSDNSPENISRKKQMFSELEKAKEQYTTDRGDYEYKKLRDSVISTYVDRYIKYYTNKEKSKSFFNIIDPIVNINKGLAFLIGKSNISIVARHITHHNLTQIANASVNTPIILTEGGYLVNNSDIMLDINYVNEKGEPVNITTSALLYSKNIVRDPNTKEVLGIKNNKGDIVIKPGDKIYPSLSGVTSVDGDNILENISAFINAYVDVAKDPFIFDMNGGEEVVDSFMYLLRLGASLDSVTMLLNQPSVKDFVKSKAMFKSNFRKAYNTSMTDVAIAANVMSNYDSENYYKLLTSEEFYSMPKDQIAKEYLKLGAVSDVKNAMNDFYTENYNEYLDTYANWAKNNIKMMFRRKQLGLSKLSVNTTFLHEKLHSHTVTRGRKTLWTRADDVYNYKTSNVNPNTSLLVNMAAVKSNDINSDVQKQALDTFLEVKRQAGNLRLIMDATSQDTHGTSKTLDQTVMKSITGYNNIAKDYIRNARRIITNTIVDPFDSAIHFTINSFSPMYLKYSFGESVTETYANLKEDLMSFVFRDKDREKFSSYIDSEFINFIIHSQFTSSEYGIDSKSIFRNLVMASADSRYTNKGLKLSNNEKDGKLSLIEFVRRVQIKDTTVTNEYDTEETTKLVKFLQNNSFFNKLETVGREIIINKNRESLIAGRLSATNDTNLSLGFPNSDFTKQERNKIIQDFKAIKRVDEGLYYDLITLALAQFGLSGGRYSFATLIPPTDIAALTTMKLNEFNSIGVELKKQVLNEFFERQIMTNYRSIKFMPVAKTKKGLTPDDLGIDDAFFSDVYGDNIPRVPYINNYTTSKYVVYYRVDNQGQTYAEVYTDPVRSGSGTKFIRQVTIVGAPNWVGYDFEITDDFVESFLKSQEDFANIETVRSSTKITKSLSYIKVPKIDTERIIEGIQDVILIPKKLHSKLSSDDFPKVFPIGDSYYTISSTPVSAIPEDLDLNDESEFKRDLLGYDTQEDVKSKLHLKYITGSPDIVDFVPVYIEEVSIDDGMFLLSYKDFKEKKVPSRVFERINTLLKENTDLDIYFFNINTSAISDVFELDRELSNPESEYIDLVKLTPDTLSDYYNMKERVSRLYNRNAVIAYDFSENKYISDLREYLSERYDVDASYDVEIIPNGADTTEDEFYNRSNPSIKNYDKKKYEESQGYTDEEYMNVLMNELNKGEQDPYDVYGGEIQYGEEGESFDDLIPKTEEFEQDITEEFTTEVLEAEVGISDNAILFNSNNKNSYLSNAEMLVNPIVDELGLEYYTVEAFYQANKVANTGDVEKVKQYRKRFAGKKVMDKDKPATNYKGKEIILTGKWAREEGKKLPLRNDWAEVRVSVMREAIKQKFDKNPTLRNKLLNTGNKQLVEYITWRTDNLFWGISSVSRKGSNVTGKLLEEYRKVSSNTEKYKGLRIVNKDKADRFPSITSKIDFNADVLSNIDYGSISDIKAKHNKLEGVYTLRVNTLDTKGPKKITRLTTSKHLGNPFSSVYRKGTVTVGFNDTIIPYGKEFRTEKEKQQNIDVATTAFYDWLVGKNTDLTVYGSTSDQKLQDIEQERRKFIVDFILSSTGDEKLLYHTRKNDVNHAMVISYLMKNKELLPEYSTYSNEFDEYSNEELNDADDMINSCDV